MILSIIFQLQLKYKQFYIMINTIIPDQLIDLIQKVRQNQIFSQALESFKEKYNICGTNVNFLTPQKVLQTYSIIKKKFYYERKNPANCSWFENQLRIFIWVLLCYLFVNKKDILEMTQSDWSFFKPIFYNREPILFEFQGILLIKERNSKWQDQEIKLLDKIVKIKSLRNKWNSIARELYIMSNKQYIKTPKQCRQRWLNYLDPSKVHSPWTYQEDLALLSSIRDYGKRWAYTVKKLLKKRTEHMVKNRFNSLINNQKKRIGNKNQNQLLFHAIQTTKLFIIEESKLKISQSNIIAKLEPSQKNQEKQKIQTMKTKKRYSKREENFKKPDKIKNDKEIISMPTLNSFPTQSNIQIQIKIPAENNKCKIQEEINQLQFFQQNQSAIDFNPFEECTPSNNRLVPNFFLYQDVSQSSQNNPRKTSIEMEEKNFQNFYFFN